MVVQARSWPVSWRYKRNSWRPASVAHPNLCVFLPFNAPGDADTRARPGWMLLIASQPGSLCSAIQHAQAHAQGVDWTHRHSGILLVSTTELLPMSPVMPRPVCCGEYGTSRVLIPVLRPPSILVGAHGFGLESMRGEAATSTLRHKWFQHRSQLYYQRRLR